MKFDRINIERQKWGIDKDKIIGEIAFENQYSKVSVKLNEEQALKMLDIVAEALVTSAHETAKMLITDIGRPKAEIEGEVQ